MLAGKLWPNGEFWVGHLAKVPSKLGLVNPPNSHRQPRGLEGISSHGKRLIRQGCYLMFQECESEDMTFLTLSPPGESIQQAEKLAQGWAEMVRKLVQELKRQLKRARLPAEVVGCTEIQPKRFESTGQPWNHLHLVFQGRKSSRQPWAISPRFAERLWRDGCNRAMGTRFKNVSPGVEFEKCWSDPSKYLSKYLSKGETLAKEVRHTYPDWPLPRCWYVCSNDLRVRIARGTRRLTPKQAASIMAACRKGLQSLKIFAELAYGSGDGGDSPVMGYVGRLSAEWARELHQRGSPAQDGVVA